jgi:hypothetical protein
MLDLPYSLPQLIKDCRAAFKERVSIYGKLYTPWAAV